MKKCTNATHSIDTNTFNTYLPQSQQHGLLIHKTLVTREIYQQITATCSGLVQLYTLSGRTFLDYYPRS